MACSSHTIAVMLQRSFCETLARVIEPEKYEKGTDNLAKHKKQCRQTEYPTSLNMVTLSNPAKGARMRPCKHRAVSTAYSGPQFSDNNLRW